MACWPPGGDVPCDNGSPLPSRPSPSSPSRWDLSQSPLLIAGDDGRVHETRPTASLARDLAEAEDDTEHVVEDRRASNRSAGRSPNAGANVSSVAACRLPQPRGRNVEDRPLRPSADERPLRPMPGFGPLGAGGGRAAATAFGGAAGGSHVPASWGSPTSTTRPRGGSLGTVGSTGGSGWSPSSPSSGPGSTRRRSYPGGAVGPPPGAASVGYTGVVAAVSTASPSCAASPRSERLVAAQRRASRPYAPIDALLAMGFDEASARVAIAAAGGDIDRAVRIIMEDAQAHDARIACEWEFEGDAGWAPFDCDTEALLRKAYSQGTSAVEVASAGRRYLIDFDSMTQLNLASRRTRRIRRRVDAATAASSSSSAPVASESSEMPFAASTAASPQPLLAQERARCVRNVVRSPCPAASCDSEAGDAAGCGSRSSSHQAPRMPGSREEQRCDGGDGDAAAAQGTSHPLSLDSAAGKAFASPVALPPVAALFPKQPRP